jgi:hypothetical protein
MKITQLPEPLNRNESGRFGALKSDSTHKNCRRPGVAILDMQISKLHIISGYESSDKLSDRLYVYISGIIKGNNKITELRTILQRESQNS